MVPGSGGGCQTKGAPNTTKVRGLLQTNVHVPSKVHTLKPNEQWMAIGGGAFGRCLGRKTGALMNGVRAPRRDP